MGNHDNLESILFLSLLALPYYFYRQHSNKLYDILSDLLSHQVLARGILDGQSAMKQQRKYNVLAYVCYGSVLKVVLTPIHNPRLQGRQVLFLVKSRSGNEWQSLCPISNQFKK